MKKYLFIFLLVGVWSCSLLKAEEKKLYSELYHRKKTNQILDSRTYEPYNGKVYYKKIKRKYLMGSVINGKIDGKWKTFYDNGKKESIGLYTDGKKDGEWNVFYDNGKKKIIESYINGKKDGKFERYYKNGVLKISGTLKNSMLDGEYKSFHENGLKWTERLYENDKIIGYDRVWSDDGGIIKNWEEDNNDGKANKYFIVIYIHLKLKELKLSRIIM